MNRLSFKLNKLLDSPLLDNPDNARRRRLLNIILWGLIVASIFTLIASGIRMLQLSRTDEYSDSGIQQIFYSGFALLIGLILFYLLNRSRYIPAWVTSSIFLIFMMLLLAFTDDFSELANGRSLFVFSLPVIMASMLLQPASSFIFAILSAIEIGILANLADVPFNIAAAIGYLFLALISWLSSRSLEQALRELRDINTNLDQIVKERTHALAEALTRERIEAGRSQAILESIADGVVVFDTQGSAIQANPALSNLINVPLNNIVNAMVSDLVETSPMDAKNKSLLAGVLTKKGSQQASHRVEWGKKTLSISSGQVLDRDGSEVGTVAVFRDFTKEAELEKMKSAFVAMVSHELRTPISAILGYAEIFKEQIYGPLNDKQAKMTSRIVSNSSRLLNLINDLLDQAQMEAGKLKIKYENIKLSDLLENIHSVMDKLTTDKGLKLTSELDPNMPEVLTGDSARLQQILINLVSNAVKFTDEGSIHVQLSRLDETQWGISVSDTGTGISKEEIPYIFETFRQVEGTTTRIHGGFGLGLSIVRQLVNLMGGSISVSSELGLGSTFSISLPIDVKIKS
jgi:signal transduction histidine kinase